MVRSAKTVEIFAKSKGSVVYITTRARVVDFWTRRNQPRQFRRSPCSTAQRLIEVNTAIFSPPGASAGVGFAVSVDTVNRVIPQLIASGRYALDGNSVESVAQLIAS